MNNKRNLHIILTYAIATVWIVNGLFCKILNLIPRHQLIVARILGHEYAGLFTKAIGISEVLMAVWIVSHMKSRLCAIIQITIVATMNFIEFVSAPDLLLFGKINAVIAFLFISVVFFNEFILNKQPLQQY